MAPYILCLQGSSNNVAKVCVSVSWEEVAAQTTAQPADNLSWSEAITLWQRRGTQVEANSIVVTILQGSKQLATGSVATVATGQQEVQLQGGGAVVVGIQAFKIEAGTLRVSCLLPSDATPDTMQLIDTLQACQRCVHCAPCSASPAALL